MDPSSAVLPFAAETEACRTAQRAWSGRPVFERVRPLGTLRRLLVEHADAVCAAVEKDVGRPPAEVITTDLLPAADSCKYHQKKAAQVLSPRRVSVFSRPLWLFGTRDTVYRRPHGVVGIIGTWNYPIYLNAIQILQALTAGNGVLWKPSEFTARTAVILRELFLKAGYPANLVQRLPATREAGPQLAEADVDHVIFTGSANVGRKLAARLGERLVSSTLELSGVDAMFVFADADVEMAAKAAWFGVTLNRGQTCLAVRRIFVQSGVYDAFLSWLRPKIEAAEPMRLVMKSQVEQMERLLDDANSKGGKVVKASRSVNTDDQTCLPQLVVDGSLEMQICNQDCFAPIAAVLRFQTIEDALAKDAQCSFALGASIFTSDKERAREVAMQ